MNVEQVKAKFLKEFQEEQVAVNFGHAALAAELAEDEDEKEEERKSLIEWHIKKGAYHSRESLKNMSYEQLKESEELYYEMAIRGI
jgi:hypothetical protein